MFTKSFGPLSGAARAARLAPLLAALLVAPSAWAQSAADIASARDLVAEGRAARDRQDFLTARNKFQAAHALLHAPITGLDLAKAEVALGHLADAREVCLDVERSEKNPKETKASAAARAEASALAVTLEKQLAAVQIVLPAGLTEVRVTVDDREIPAAALGAKRRLDPGSHRVTAARPGGPVQEMTITLAPGESRDVPVNPGPAPVVVVPKKNEEKQVVVAAPIVRHSTSPLVPVGGVLLAGGLVTGLGAGLFAMNSLKECDGSAKTCPTHAPIAAAKSWATVSTVGLAVGGVGAALLVVGLATPKTEVVLPGSAVRVRPEFTVGTNGGFVGISGGFQ
jgi:hypothetical protein